MDSSLSDPEASGTSHRCELNLDCQGDPALQTGSLLLMFPEERLLLVAGQVLRVAAYTQCEAKGENSSLLGWNLSP